MKLAVFCLVVVTTVLCAPQEQYTNRFDNINVDEILHNDRLLKRYVDCLLDKPNVRCPPEAVELKKYIHEALETECAKCSDHQKQVVRKVIKFLVINKRDMWNDLKAKYDPDGEFTKKYENMAKEEGVQI
ncbi:hypothetical protein P5V15_005243 [Pogonomyrmex californicus]